MCVTCQRTRTRRSSRGVHLAETYGITQADYDRLLEAQGGVCAICGRKPRGNLDVDHDHKLERDLRAAGVPDIEATRRSIRGLLCRTDNRRVLRGVRDSVATLQAAIAYLEAPPAQQGILTD